MRNTDGAKPGSLASYERKFGSLELMLRYARGRVRMFWARQLFMFLAFAALGLVLPPVYAFWRLQLQLPAMPRIACCCERRRNSSRSG